MQKIQSYLYPNRVLLLADLAGFTVENKVVYARKIKLYAGLDNVLEFDIQNADQKRIDLTTLGALELNIMDASNNAVSSYDLSLLTSASATDAVIVGTSVKASTTTITVPTANVTGAFSVTNQLVVSGITGPVVISSVTKDVDSATTTLMVTFPSQTVAGRTGAAISSVMKGLATVTIPSEDLHSLTDQLFHYSVSAVDNLGNQIPLYCDSQFGAVGTIQLIGNAMPTFRDDVIYDSFVGEINFMGNVTNHTPAVPCKFYEATATTMMNFDVYLDNFIGTVYVEATEDMTISVGSFLNAPHLQSFTCTTSTTTMISFNNVPVVSTGGQYNYMRVSWLYPNVWQYGSQQNPTIPYGSVTKVVVSS